MLDSEGLCSSHYLTDMALTPLPLLWRISLLIWDPHQHILEEENTVTYPTVTIVFQDIVDSVNLITHPPSPLSECPDTMGFEVRGNRGRGRADPGTEAQGNTHSTGASLPDTVS